MAAIMRTWKEIRAWIDNMPPDYLDEIAYLVDAKDDSYMTVIGFNKTTKPDLYCTEGTPICMVSLKE